MCVCCALAICCLSQQHPIPPSQTHLLACTCTVHTRTHTLIRARCVSIRRADGAGSPARLHREEEGRVRSG